MRRRGACALLLLCTLLGSACNGKESTSAGAAPAPISKDSYVIQANAICTKMNDGIDGVPDPGSDPESVARGIDKVAAIVTTGLTQLRALPAPAGDEAVVRAVWAKNDAALADLLALSAAARDGDEAHYNELYDKFEASSTSANEAALAYGLTVCGADGEE